MRNEERYLPGFLHHVRDHVDGIIALDDCSSDGTVNLLRREPRVISLLEERDYGPAHANEAKNRYRLLVEAAKLDAQWVLCADADERYEEKFLRHLPEEVAIGERTGHYVRSVKIVNLWNSKTLYRADGYSGPRWTPRMFKIPRQITQRPSAMHRAWFPPELDSAPKARMNAYLYHLKMIERNEREKRFEKFVSVDPNNEHQAIGYRHLIDEANLKLRPVLPWRNYIDLSNDRSSAQVAQQDIVETGRSTEPPTKAEFDELFYLNQNLDVQKAVENGYFTSGWNHFEVHGAREGRVWRQRPRVQGFDFGAIINKWHDAAR